MRGVIAWLVVGCSSPGEPIRSLSVGVQSAVHVTAFGTEIITAPSGRLQVAGGECAGECGISLDWSQLSLADFTIGGHVVSSATLALDHQVDGRTFSDGTFLINPSGVTATLKWTLDGAPATTSLSASAPLAGAGAPSGTPTVVGDFQSTDVLLHLLLQTL